MVEGRIFWGLLFFSYRFVVLVMYRVRRGGRKNVYIFCFFVVVIKSYRNKNN